MKPSLRVYGEIKGVSSDDWNSEECARIRKGLFLETVAYENGKIVLEHESFAMDRDDVEELLRFAVRVMAPTGSGHCEYIDNDAWELTRYVLKPGELVKKTLPIDAVLEGMEPIG